MSHAQGSGPAPLKYIEMMVLPARGWPKSEQDRLSLIERHELLTMMSLEARYTAKRD